MTTAQTPKTPENMTPAEMRRDVLRTMYLLQNQLKEAEDEYLRLTRKRRTLLREAAKLIPVTELAKTLRVSRQKVYQIMNQE